MSALGAALKVGAIGMCGVFGFMVLFYLAIRLIDRWFPNAEEHHEER
jgi:Na+-transporting methylmalonyl-CoA/oxaloacetate decarboxylase gamma subunit